MEKKTERKLNNREKPNISRSNAIYSRAKQVIPGGSQTFSKGVSQFVNGFSPKYLERGKGAYAWDVDGNRYLDYVMGCHPLILGYSDPDVNAAVIEQLDRGSTFSLMNELEVEVSEKLVEVVPCAEMVRFGKNGADANSAGLRIARAITGRDHVAYCGYHGWHDWFIANTDLNSGIPEFNRQLAHSFEYNNLDSIERIFDSYPKQIALVILEPLTVFPPKCFASGEKCEEFHYSRPCEHNFLLQVQEVAKHHGALLMFDEVITGFRYALGGAQELTGVVPDLASFAKGISNGVPLSAIVGKKEYMESLQNTFFSFTYGGDCIGLAAANACIPKLVKEQVPTHLRRVGEALRDGLNTIFEDHQVSDFASAIGYPQRSIITLSGNGSYDPLEIKSFFQQELIRRGILWAGYHALSFAHKDHEIAVTLEAFDEVCGLFGDVIRRRVSLREMIEGEVVKPVFRQVADFNSFISR